MNSANEKMDQRSAGKKVLLCVLKPALPIDSYSNSLLIDVFEQFGRVMGLRIIERNVKLKALVEFECNEQLEFALQKLHKATVENVGTFEVYPSNKTCVSTQPSNQNSSEYDWQSHSDRNYPSEDFFQSIHFNKKPTINSMEDIHLDFVRARPKIFSLAEIPNSTDNFPQNHVMYEHELSGRVLMLNRLDFSKVNKQMIANLLSCFGNVSKVIVNSQNLFALVEVQNHDQALAIISNLNGLLFFGKPLKIKISKYQSLNLKKLDPLLNPGIDSLAIGAGQNRIKADSEFKLVAPTSVLLMSDLPTSITPKMLFDIVSIIHEPAKLKSVFSQDPEKLQFLLQFESSSQACDVLAIFHKKQFDSDVISVSFTDLLINN